MIPGLGPSRLIIDCCIKNAIDYHKKEGNSDCTIHPRSFWVELQIPLIDWIASSTNCSRSLGQLLASVRFAKDQTPSSGLSSGA